MSGRPLCGEVQMNKFEHVWWGGGGGAWATCMVEMEQNVNCD